MSVWNENGPCKARHEGDVMGFTLQQKRALFWGLGILAGFALAHLAWAQIASGISHCFSPF